METQSFKVEIKIVTLHAKIPMNGELLIVLKDGIFVNLNEILEDTRINQAQNKVSLTFQLSADGAIKPLGINRLEMSQFLQNAPLGKCQSCNLKILKCQFDSDAFVSLQITILEQTYDRLTDDSFKSETSSRISSDARSSIGQSQSNSRSENSNASSTNQKAINNPITKVLSQSRSEKNFTGMKFKKNAIRLVNQQNNSQGVDSHSQSPDDKNLYKNIIVQQPTKVQVQAINNNVASDRIDSLIKSLNDDEKEQKYKLQQEQIVHMKKQIDSLSLENQELKSIKEQQDALINHLKQRVQNTEGNKQLEIDNQNMRKQLQDMQAKYQHLLAVFREQQNKSSPGKQIKSMNTTEEDDESHSQRHMETVPDVNSLFDSREEFKQMPQFGIKDKYNYLKRKIAIIISDKEAIESQLVHAKMQWASIELERDNLSIKLNHQTEKFAQLMEEQVQLQNVLVKTKQELGEALNQVYEFERVNRILLEKYGDEAKEEETKELQEIRQDSKESVVTPSSSKQEKKPSRIKKFFKK